MPSSPTPGIGPLASALLTLAKPLLHLHLHYYRREVAQAPFPVDEPDFAIPGEDPDRLLFVGSIAVAGFGVLRHGMKTSGQAAGMVAASRKRGLVWDEVSSPVMTSHEAARLPSRSGHPSDVAVVILGICDVLVVTDPSRWARNLRTLVAGVRRGDGARTPIVFAGIPPMADFREIPPLARRMITWQVNRLNAATQRVVEATPCTEYVPFPSWDVGDLFLQDALSWSTMHKLWGRAIAPTVADRLGAVDRTPRPAVHGAFAG